MSAHSGSGRVVVPTPCTPPKARCAHHDSTLRAARIGIHPHPQLLVHGRRLGGRRFAYLEDATLLGVRHQLPRYDRLQGRRWRHLDLAGMKWHLRYDTRRVDCPCCGVVVEHVPWADVGSWFTRPFEDQVGYLAQRSDKTTVHKLMRIAWTTVGDIIQRVVQRHQRGDLLDGLTHIGVDELSYRRHHEYVTVVVDHKTQRIVWAKKGKNAATLTAFFDELGPERVKKLKAVTIDMSAAYIKAVTAAAPKAQIIFDRFHVQRLAHDAGGHPRIHQLAALERSHRGAQWQGSHHYSASLRLAQRLCSHCPTQALLLRHRPRAGHAATEIHPLNLYESQYSSSST